MSPSLILVLLIVSVGLTTAVAIVAVSVGRESAVDPEQNPQHDGS